MGQAGGRGRDVGLRGREARRRVPGRRACTRGVWGGASLFLQGLPDRQCRPPTQGTFQQMWISKQEYEEGGKQCVERKCP